MIMILQGYRLMSCDTMRCGNLTGGLRRRDGRGGSVRGLHHRHGPIPGLPAHAGTAVCTEAVKTQNDTVPPAVNGTLSASASFVARVQRLTSATPPGFDRIGETGLGRREKQDCVFRPFPSCIP